MKKIMSLTSAAFAISLAMSACSTAPTNTAMLDQARGDFMAAQNNPSVAANAPLEFKSATDALDRANAASAHGDSTGDVDKLAYIAKQRIATAQEVSRAKQAEAQVAQAERQRDQIQLQQRTQEAQAARSQADQARASADQAKLQAASAEQQARDEQARSAALAAQLSDLQAKQTERGYVITFNDVLFNVDRAELSAEGMRVAQKLADILNQDAKGIVMVEGFTDSTGTASHNLELSQRRAESVRNALIGMGISDQRIATHGYGQAYPVASNDSAGNRQLNRRVEIVLSQNGAPISNRH